MEGKHARKYAGQPSENDTIHDQQTQQIDIGRLDDEYDEGFQSNALEIFDGRDLQHQQQTQQSNFEFEEMRGELIFEGDAPPPSYEQSCNDRQI